MGPLVLACLLSGGVASTAESAVSEAPAASAAPASALATAPRVGKPPRPVLVLYSNGRLLPANIEFDKGLRQSILAQARPGVEILDEFLDVPRFDSPEHLSTMQAYLRDKYAHRRPEVLVTAGEEAVRFLAAHRGDLFTGVPLVFGAVTRAAVSALEPLPANVIGTPLEFDFTGTITQAMQWHPQARRLWIVTGRAEWDRLAESRLRLEAKAFADRLTIEFLAALPVAELVQRLGTLGSDSIVFTPGMFQDGEGRNFVPRESVELLATAASAPVYGGYVTHVGTGIVGGRLSSFKDAGIEAGRAAGELLAGLPPAAVGLPEIVPATLQVDWRQIRRWRIDERAIPAGTVVHFREPTLFEAYRTQVLLASAALVFQTGLIGLLLVERRRRRAAELSRQTLRLELAHAARLAVAGELLGSIAHEINQPLGAILANADAADLLLATGTGRHAELAEILSDIRRDDLRASEVIRKLRTLLSRHEVERQHFDLVEAAREVESLLRTETRRRGVTLDLQTSVPGGAALFHGDRIQIQQVLLNLVFNAMDAVAGAPEGRRAITLAVAAGREAEGVVEISVRDRGQGIAPENLPKLFDSFFTTKGQGMGLGLSIARTLVEAHGGRIRADSVPGEGSVFRIEFPARQPKETA